MGSRLHPSTRSVPREWTGDQENCVPYYNHQQACPNVQFLTHNLYLFKGSSQAQVQTNAME